MIKKTALYSWHMQHGAKMVPFSGFDMPLSFSGILDEHQIVRRGVGLFDISHMGRFELSGKGADAYLDHLTPGPLQKLQKGSAQYSMLLNHKGGIIDDIYIYKKGVNRFSIIVNAANREGDFKWMTSCLPPQGPSLQDVSAETGLIALQGPKSWEVLQRIIPFGYGEIPLRGFIETELLIPTRATALVARTGYTGERGYELVLPIGAVETVWIRLMELGSPEGIQPIGLGARDTLRLEKGYLLYGHDINENRTPMEAGMEPFLRMNKDFIGREALTKPVSKKLIGFQLLEDGIPREGNIIFSEQKEIGVVTSGNFSPSLRKGIGMGYVESRFSDEGSEILIDIRGKSAGALIVKKPFYRKKK